MREDNTLDEFVSYKGDSIHFAEMPYGCEVWQVRMDNSERGSVVIESVKDAQALIESLQKMIVIMNSKNE